MKHHLISILLASTAMSAVPMLSYAQVPAPQSGAKPSVEVYMESLNSLGGSVPVVPAPVTLPAPVAAPQAQLPEKIVPVAEATNNQPSVVVTRKPLATPVYPAVGAAPQELRKPIAEPRKPIGELRKPIAGREPSQAMSQELPRHGSRVFTSRLQPLAPAPVGSVPAPVVRSQPQMVRIAPPYGAPVNAPAMPARQSIESPIVSAPAIETVQPEPVARALPEAPLAQEKSSSWWDDLSDSVSSAFDSSQPATEISQPLQAPETRAPLETPKSSANININTADAAEVDAPAVIDASKFAKEEVDKDAIVDVFSLPAEEQAAEKSTSWWDDVTDSVVGVFDSSEGQPDQAEVNKSAAMAESEPMLSTELAVPPATNDLPVPPSVSVASQAPDAAVVEAPKELPKNAASYDGLEIAEGFAAHSDFGSNTATLGVPPMAAMPVSPAPVITLPVPTVDENGDEILAQASDGDGSVGLKDPFQSGARLAPEPPAAPIKPIVPADTTAPAPVALKPKDPVVLQSAENQAVAAAVPTGKEEGTSWIGDMQDSLTSYFSEDAKKPVEPQAPLVSKDDALKVDELKAMPKEVVAKSDADTMKSMVGLNDLKPMPENPAAPAPANAPEPTPVVSKSAEKPAPKPAKASAEPRVSKAQAAPVGKVEEIIVPQPPVENKLADGKSDEIKPVAPVTQPNKTAQNTMDATVKTDASVVEKKAEPVPPAAMAEAKPVEAKPTEIAPKAETPVVPTVSAKSNESKPVVSAPPQQAPEVTVSAKAEKTVGAEKAPVTAVAAVQTPPVSTPAPTPVAVKPEEKVMASLAPDAKPAVEAKTSSATFSFVVGKSELSKESQAQLNDIAVKLKQGQNARVNVKAYATSGGGKDAGDGEVMAKRISLARGLAIRAYLIDQGVSALRINVQPLGNNSGGGNPERVDVEMTLPSGT